MVKMLTVLVSTISNSQVFWLKKCEWLLQMQKATHICFAKILAHMPYLMIKCFNNMLTNNIVSFKQLGPDIFPVSLQNKLWILIRSASTRHF